MGRNRIIEIRIFDVPCPQCKGEINLRIGGGPAPFSLRCPQCGYESPPYISAEKLFDDHKIKHKQKHDKE